jgi:hypothetical protein
MGKALEAPDSARNSQMTLVHTCSAACSRVSRRALHANRHEDAVVWRISQEVAALQVVPLVSTIRTGEPMTCPACCPDVILLYTECVVSDEAMVTCAKRAQLTRRLLAAG